MNKIASIEKEVESLSESELAAFRAWFYEFDAAAWDHQIESDARSGKLDALADSAIEAYESGKCTEL